jgi:hypothetical protein
VINIVTALKIEAKPIIEHFKLKPGNGIYKNEKINLIITGQGKIKSAINTALLLSRFQLPTVNFGICGSNKYDVNQGFFIHKIIDTDTSFEYYPDFFKDNSETLHTVSKINKYFPLTDMEASGFFEACYKFLNVDDIIVYKIVSDTPFKAPKNIHDLIKSHLSVIERLSEEKKQPDFYKDIDEFINFTKSKIKLTNTQISQLKQILILYKIKNLPFPDIPHLKKKEEIKKFITSLFSSLETW